MTHLLMLAQEKENPWLLFGILMIGGAFATICSALDADWFFSSSKAAFFVAIFGRNGARIFYGLLGILMMGFAVFTLF
jgi:Immunity protein 17